ncbi:hypothetical protein Ahy_A06g026334 isoform B [Arachis hypogaea]|uniref:BFN domain-containing protein n=1 Tax=Arachis hypogaea TaxID=3818 RepID=A0A445CK49_ARAHY|nr:hypothetical protein Ahy_A06g026334 isoform B [Arachis hypogaea]
MGSLQGPVLCPSVHAKLAGLFSLPMIGPMNVRCFRSEFWGFKELGGGSGGGAKVKPGILSCNVHMRKCKTAVHCSFNSSSNDSSGSAAENFNEKDEDYVNSSIVEAVEVKSGADGFIIKMRDGRHLRCVHNNPQGGHLPEYAPHPAIVLKMEDGTGLLLPIIVCKSLYSDYGRMQCYFSFFDSYIILSNVNFCYVFIGSGDAERFTNGSHAQCSHSMSFSHLNFAALPLNARPTLYQVVKEMVDKMGYEVWLDMSGLQEEFMRHISLSCILLRHVGNEAESMSFDLRPSDAINIAVRCKVPIQVNKYLAFSDGMRVVESGKLSTQFPLDGQIFAELDKPSGQPCVETQEFNLLHEMLKAVNEERYQDAALWRDQLNQLRSGKNVNNR